MAESTIQGVTFVAALSVAVWLYLIFFRGGFWRADQRLGEIAACGGDWPEIAVVMPARNEAPLVGRTVAALMAQDYPGPYEVIVVDDDSCDGTAAIAQAAGARLTVARPLPEGWTGKLWALAKG